MGADFFISICEDVCEHKRAQEIIEYRLGNLSEDILEEIAEQYCDVDDAIRLFNDSYLYADNELKFEINFRKDAFAKHVLDSLNSNFDDMSIEQIGSILKGATSISSEELASLVSPISLVIRTLMV